MSRSTGQKNFDVTPPELLGDQELRSRHLELAVREEKFLSDRHRREQDWTDSDANYLNAITAEVERRHSLATQLWRRILRSSRASEWSNHLEQVAREVGIKAVYRHARRLPDQDEAE